MCSGSEAGSYLRLIDFVYHSTLGLRKIKKKKDAHRHAAQFLPDAFPPPFALGEHFAEESREHLRTCSVSEKPRS